MDIARHHVALVQPKILILLGPQLCQLVSGRTIVPATEDQPIINHIAPKTDAFAVHHPRMLIERPQLKRHAWEVLKRVRELI
jgi:DNA polymerase